MENEKNINRGLSDGNKKFIVALVVVILLLFGPVEPYGLVIRFSYLIIVPTLVWLVLWHWGKNWNMDQLSNDRLNRTLVAIIAGALLVGAYLSYTAKYHAECTQYVRTPEGGSECVGDYITVKGSDKFEVLMEVVFAGIAIWYAVSRRQKSD